MRNSSHIRKITNPATFMVLPAIEVIVGLQDDGTVRLADRADAIRPSHAKRSDVRKILNVAARHFAELVELWEKMHA